MKFISFVIGYSRRSVMLAVLAGIISGACSTGLIASINAALRSNGSHSRLLVWSFVGLCLALPLARLSSEILLTHLGQRALLNLRLQLSRQILAAPLRHLEELGFHRLLAALTEDVPVITNALMIIPVLCINCAVVLAGLLYLGWLSWTLLLLVLGFMVLGIITYQVPMLRAVRWLRLAREESDALLKHFHTLIDGSKELKLHRRRRDMFFAKVLQPTAESFRRLNVKGMTLYIAAASWGQTLVFIVVGLVLFALPTLKATNAPTLTGYVLVLLYLMAPLQVVMNTVPALSRANVAVKKLADLGLSLAACPTEPDAPFSLEPEPSWTRLEMVGVTHAYCTDGEESNFILGPIDLTFYPGELVFLVGGNGSGKTTLAKLLTGIYAEESGEIHLNDKLITDRNRDYYRQHFSVVFSDFHLFESLLGLETPNLDQRAENYLTQLRLNHKVSVANGVLSTTELSQGQRKRLALLTAYLEDRPFYLFDEWAADQDPLFKRFFYQQLLPELKSRGKTIVVISHDDQYYHLADRLIKLDYGKISYDQLTTFSEQASLGMPLPLGR
jgi:putative ATP-binding cassette transporter